MADRGVAEGILRHATDHRGLMAHPRQPDRDIGLGTADMGVEPTGLEQQFAARRGQPEQQFAEAHNSFHQRASQPPSTARMWPWT
jgi:hypothetical protein